MLCKLFWVCLNEQETVKMMDLEVVNALEQHLMDGHVDSRAVLKALTIVHGDLILDAIYILNVLFNDKV